VLSVVDFFLSRIGCVLSFVGFVLSFSDLILDLFSIACRFALAVFDYVLGLVSLIFSQGSGVLSRVNFVLNTLLNIIDLVVSSLSCRGNFVLNGLLGRCNLLFDFLDGLASSSGGNGSYVSKCSLSIDRAVSNLLFYDTFDVCQA